MLSSPTVLTTLGLLLLGGLATDYIGQHTFLPRVSALILFGFLTGPPVLDILPDMSATWFPHITNIVLTMVGFLLGSSLTAKGLKKSGTCVIGISLSVVIATTVIVSAGLFLIGVPLTISLVCGAIASSTAPTATLDIVHELKTKSRFSKILLGITAIDDAWGLIIFSLMLLLVQPSIGESIVRIFPTEFFWDIGGAVILGIALGLPMSFLTGRLQAGEPTLIEAIGMVLLCGGLALWLQVSNILAAMTMGVVVVNYATHHTRPFRAIESLERPLFIIFFVFSGASIHLEEVIENWLVIFSYIFLRIVSRLVGGKLGGKISKAAPSIQNWMGVALMPQAGVALGMALIASQRFPELASIVTIIVTATVFFEITGPVCTRLALKKMESTN